MGRSDGAGVMGKNARGTLPVMGNSGAGKGGRGDLARVLFPCPIRRPFPNAGLLLYYPCLLKVP